MYGKVGDYLQSIRPRIVYYSSMVYQWRYFWPIAIFLAVILAAILTRRYWFRKPRSWDEDWLSFHIRKHKAKYDQRTIWRKLRDKSIPFLIYPNLLTPIIILVFVLFFHHIFQWLNLRFWFPITKDTEILSYLVGLWQIEIALAAVALPIMLFVIERSKDEEQSAVRSSVVLIRSTWIFPVIVFAIISGVKFGYDFIHGNVSPETIFYDFFLFVLTSALTGIAYYRIIKLVLNPYILRKKSIDVLREKVGQSIEQSISTRIGNSILHRFLKEVSILYTWPILDRDRREQNHIIYSRRYGTIIDINLAKLQSLAGELNRQEGGLSSEVLEKSDFSGSVSQPNSATSAIARRVSRRPYDLYILKQYRDDVYDDHLELLMFLKDACLEDSLDSIQKNAEGTFRIREEKFDSGEAIISELEYLKDDLIEAIKAERVNRLEKGLEIYRAIVEVFLGKLKFYEATYSYENAMRERSALTGGWKEIRLVSSDLREILDSAFSTRNRDIITRIMYFPIVLASLALRQNDYFIFDQFIEWIPYSYTLSLQIEDSGLRAFLIDRCWRYLRDLADFDVERRLKEITEPGDELNATADFAVGVIMEFQQLLKVSCDHPDIESFKLFRRKLDSLFSLPGDREYEIADAEAYLKNSPALTNPQKESIEHKLAFLRELQKVEESIRLRRQQVVFGIGAWIIHEYQVGKLDEDSFRELYQSIGGFGNLDALTKLYSQTHSREVEIFFRWDFWLRNIEEERFFTSTRTDFRFYITKFYCLKALESLNVEPEVEHRKYELPIAQGEGSEIQTVLQSIEQDLDKWKCVLGPNGASRVSMFMQMIQDGIEEQKEKEVDELIGKELDPKKIELFKKGLIEAWGSGAALRGVIKQYGSYEFVDDVPSEEIPFSGFNIRQQKELYISDQSSMSYEGIQAWGENYGRGLSSGETDLVFSQIASSVQSISVQGDILKSLDYSIEYLHDSGYKPNIIITNRMPDRALKESEHYETDTHEHRTYRGICVEQIHTNSRASCILVADAKKVGIWKQYRPEKAFEEEEHLSDGTNDVLGFYIKEYNEDRAKRLIKDQPNLLRDEQTSEERTQNEAIREILQYVHLLIVEQFIYEITDKEAGGLICFT